MKFYPNERVALFIDGANLYSAARSLGFEIDYRRLLETFRKETNLVRAFYYTALAEDQEYSPLRPLIDWLDYNGFTLVTKPAKEYTDAMGRRKFKGNMDIELAIDMMELAPRIDHAVLFSGDGDFRRLVEAVQRLGVRVTVVATIKTQPPMVADELRRQADSFVDITELMPKIARDTAGREASRTAGLHSTLRSGPRGDHGRGDHGRGDQGGQGPAMTPANVGNHDDLDEIDTANPRGYSR